MSEQRLIPALLQQIAALEREVAHYKAVASAQADWLAVLRADLARLGVRPADHPPASPPAAG